MASFTVGLVYTDRQWRTAFQKYVRDHVSGVAVRLVRDTRMALEEHVDVLVVDDGTSFLSGQLVEGLRRREVPIVGIYGADEPDVQGAAVLKRLGVDLVLPSTVEPEELLERLRTLCPKEGLELGQQVEEVFARVALDEPSLGSVVAVGGPSGAGATEVAVALAALAAARSRTLLLDIDEVSPGVGRRLGRSLYPHLLSAVDELRGGASLSNEGSDRLSKVLARAAPGHDEALPFDVIVGLHDPDEWVSLRPEDVVGLLHVSRSAWETVVVNLGPHLDDLSRWVPRYAASRAAAETASVVIATCEATPRGVVRFVDWLVQLTALRPAGADVMVLNRAPRSPTRRAQLVEALREHVGDLVHDIVVAPDDRAVQRASWDGILVPSRRPFVRSLTKVAEHVVCAGAVPIRSVR